MGVGDASLKMKILYTQIHNLYYLSQRVRWIDWQMWGRTKWPTGEYKLNSLCKNTKVYSSTPMYRFNIPPHGGRFYKYAVSSQGGCSEGLDTFRFVFK